MGKMRAGRAQPALERGEGMRDRVWQVSGLVLFCGVLAGSSGARAAIETAVTLSPTHAVAGDSVEVAVYYTNPAGRSETVLIQARKGPRKGLRAL